MKLIVLTSPSRDIKRLSLSKKHSPAGSSLSPSYAKQFQLPKVPRNLGDLSVCAAEYPAKESMQKLIASLLVSNITYINAVSLR